MIFGVLVDFATSFPCSIKNLLYICTALWWDDLPRRIRALRKVRTGKGARLWKAQRGAIFCGRNRKQPPRAFGRRGKGENAG